MWTCKQCDEQIEDQFDSCWKCEDAADPESSGLATAAVPPNQMDSMPCPRCHYNLQHDGKMRLRAGTRLGAFLRSFLGPLGELLESREVFEVYVCHQCG